MVASGRPTVLRSTRPEHMHSWCVLWAPSMLVLLVAARVWSLLMFLQTDSDTENLNHVALPSGKLSILVSKGFTLLRIAIHPSGAYAVSVSEYRCLRCFLSALDTSHAAIVNCRPMRYLVTTASKESRFLMALKKPLWVPALPVMVLPSILLERLPCS